MSFSEIFKELRRSNNVSVSLLSKEIQVSRYAIMKWENGQSQPSMDAQRKICEYFHVSSDFLLGLNPNNSSINDPFIIDLSNYSSSLNDEQKKLILDFVKQISSLNKKNK